MIAAETLQELARRLSTSLTGADGPVGTLSIDTRTLQPGQLFLAIEGPHHDGHDYTGMAIEKGAAAVLVSRPVPQSPRLLVPDVTAALTALGRLNRDAFTGKVVGITGSCGKTSVKEMAAAIFSEVGPCLATHGNLNNAYGVPLTLGRLHRKHCFAVLEMGTNSPGEIAHLTDMVRPDIALLNNASISHVAGLGSLAGIVAEKGDIFNRLTDNGAAVVNLDDAHADIWIERIRSHCSANIITFGLQQRQAYSRAEQLVSAADGVHFTLHLGDQTAPVHLPLWGHHQVSNACAAAAIAHAAGIDIETVAAGLHKTRPCSGRGSRFYTEQGALLIDESYNANPASIRAAIDVLAACQGERILVLSDLSEEHFNTSCEQHDVYCQLGEYASRAGIECLITLGSSSGAMHKKFQGEVHHFHDKQSLYEQLNPRLVAGTSVLIKGCNAAGMADLVDLCLQHQTGRQPDNRGA